MILQELINCTVIKICLKIIKLLLYYKNKIINANEILSAISSDLLEERLEIFDHQLLVCYEEKLLIILFSP